MHVNDNEFSRENNPITTTHDEVLHVKQSGVPIYIISILNPQYLIEINNENNHVPASCQEEM